MYYNRLRESPHKEYAMSRDKFLGPIFSSFLMVVIVWLGLPPFQVTAQEPTATPSTNDPGGTYITVITEEPQINVRMGPGSTLYPIVGTLPRGAFARAFGRSPGGDWIQIEYVGAPNNLGWVYSPLVEVTGGTLPVAEPPPTPVPPATSTLDPTFIAQFSHIPTTTRLPTFTPPAPVIAPEFTLEPAVGETDSVPMAVILMVMAVLGTATLAVSFLFKRN